MQRGPATARNSALFKQLSSSPQDTFYTVAIVAVTQINSPQNIFLNGVNRGAAIVVGVMALALVNDLFLAPNLHTILSRKVAAVHQRVRAFAIAILRGESADPLPVSEKSCARSKLFIRTSRRSSSIPAPDGRAAPSR